MGFKAEPSSIRALGDTIDALSNDSEQAVSYVRQWLDIGHADSRMFFTVAQTASAVQQALEAYYQRLSTLVSEAGGELVRAARHYEQTDLDALERLDATYASPRITFE
jgi:antirestriction protein ArdC